jgi:hypothetical protein
MGFAITLAGLHAMALAVAGIDPTTSQAVFAIEQAGLALTIIVIPSFRHAALDCLTRFWPCALAFGAVLVLTANDAGLLGGRAIALRPFEGRSEVADLAALFLGGGAAAGVAAAVGRRAVHDALLVAGLLFAAFDAIQKFQNGPDHPFLSTPGQTAAVYALFGLLAAFVAYDELRSRSNGDAVHRRPPLVQRLLLPCVALAGALIGLVFSQAPGVGGALAAGLALCAAALAARDLRRTIGMALGAGAIALAVLAAALLFAFGAPADRFGFTGFADAIETGLKGATGLGGGAEGGLLQTWPVEAGLVGSGILVAALSVFLGLLAFQRDRKRRPSRGLALGCGALATAALAGPSGGAPAVTATLALLLGLAATYADHLRPEARTLRVEREPESADAPIEDKAEATA